MSDSPTTPQPAATSGASGERPWTAGPWTARPKRRDPQQWSIDADNGDPTLGHKRWEGLAVYGCDDMPKEGAAVAKANARLIAAAPAMYEALLDLANRAENFAHSHAMIANSKGHVEGTQLRYSIDRARAALSTAQQEAGDAGRPQGGEAV